MFQLFYLVTFLFLLSIAIRMMSQGWNLEIRNPTKRKPIHPEMKDVQPGDQLMGVTFAERPENENEDEDKFELSDEAVAAFSKLISDFSKSLQLPDDEDDDDDDEDNREPALV